MGDIVSLEAQTFPYFQLREFKCIEHYINKRESSLKPENLNIRPRSPKSNQLLSLSQCFVEFVYWIKRYLGNKGNKKPYCICLGSAPHQKQYCLSLLHLVRVGGHNLQTLKLYDQRVL